MPQSVITIDATIGGDSTNSFLSLDDMETYIHQRPFHDLWDKITDDDEKKAALLWATTILSHLKWHGAIANTTQAQAFPRTGIYDFESREYASDAYPSWLILAFVELTFVAATKDILADSETAGLKSIKLGSIALGIDTEYSKKVIPEYLMNAISPWLSAEYNSNMVSLSRV